jgi:predicted dehydrogenase
MVKIGMISFAHMHSFSYAECLKSLPNAKITAVSDRDWKRGRLASRRLKAPYFKDYQDLLKQDVDAVVICSENSRHKELAVAAARAGKHILCEKPISTNIKDAQSMIEAAREHNVKLQIAFPCRFIPAMIWLKEFLSSGGIGEVLAISATNHGTMPGSWFVDKKLSGGGAIIDHTVHIVDLIRWMLKIEVEEVYAEIDTSFFKLKIDDCGILNMKFDNGVIATLDASWSRPIKSFPTWGDVTMRVKGTEAEVYVDSFAQHVKVYNNREIKSSWQYWGDNMDIGLIKDFVKNIEENLPPSISGEDGLRAMEAALAAYRSNELKAPVKLPLTK